MANFLLLLGAESLVKLTLGEKNKEGRLFKGFWKQIGH